MKIYNRKTFFVGVYFIVMAVGLVVLCFIKEFKPYDLILAGFCALIGIPFLLRSLSYEKSRKDKLEQITPTYTDWLFRYHGAVFCHEPHIRKRVFRWNRHRRGVLPDCVPLRGDVHKDIL